MDPYPWRSEPCGPGPLPPLRGLEARGIYRQAPPDHPPEGPDRHGIPAHGPATRGISIGLALERSARRRGRGSSDVLIGPRDLQLLTATSTRSTTTPNLPPLHGYVTGVPSSRLTASRVGVPE